MNKYKTKAQDAKESMHDMYKTHEYIEIQAISQHRAYMTTITRHESRYIHKQLLYVSLINVVEDLTCLILLNLGGISTL